MLNSLGCGIFFELTPCPEVSVIDTICVAHYSSFHDAFVKELSTNSDCAAIVSAVAGLGHGLNVDTVAEGVETEDQLTLVRASGCTRAQGFLFGKPCPASDLEFGRFVEGKQSEKAA